MNPNPKNWFEIQKKRQETRADLTKETGKPWQEALGEKGDGENVPEEMNGLLKAIMEGNISSLSLDSGAVDAIAKAEHVAQLRETLQKHDVEVKGFEGTKKDLLGAYREQSQEYYTYQKTNQELTKLDQLKDEADRAIFDILKNGKGEGFTRADEEKLAEYEKVKTAISGRVRSLEQGTETALHVRMHTLSSYHEQLVKENYIETPSRTESIDWIKDQMKNHRAVLLEGATGTGKTELLLHTSKALLGKNNPEVLAGNPHVTKYDLLGSQGLESDENGTRTTDKPGYLPRAMRDGNLLILDEINQIETKVRFALKPFYRYSGVRGGSAMVEGVNYPVEDGFLIAATANLKGDKHKDRFDLDPAESRVFAMRHIEYPHAHELYDMALAALRRNDSTYIISEQSAKITLKHLTDAAHDIQEGYEKALGSEFDPAAGTKKTSLEKAVLDPGEFMAMTKSYTSSYAAGKSFEEHINDRLGDFISKGAYPEKDRVLLYKVLKSKGFLMDFNANKLHLTDDKLIDSLAQWPENTTDIFPNARGTMTEREAAMLDPYELRREMIAKTTESFVEMIPVDEREKIAESSMERGTTAYREAMETIGKENFLGPDEIKNAFGIEVKNVPKVPFSKQELIEAKRLGQELVLYVDKAKSGKPLTSFEICDTLGNKTSQGTQFFGNYEKYFSEIGLGSETPRLGWRLSSKECIPSSGSKNYFNQTQAIVDYLKNEVFKKGAVPKEYADAFAEWEKAKATSLKADSESSDDSKWKDASQKLANLKITELSRERMSEVLYRLALHEKKTGERLLDSAGRSVYYTWTSSRDSGGALVFLGHFDKAYLRAGGWRPRREYSDIGVCLSRS